MREDAGAGAGELATPYSPGVQSKRNETRDRSVPLRNCFTPGACLRISLQPSIAAGGIAPYTSWTPHSTAVWARLPVQPNTAQSAVVAISTRCVWIRRVSRQLRAAT